MKPLTVFSVYPDIHNSETHYDVAAATARDAAQHVFNTIEETRVKHDIDGDGYIAAWVHVPLGKGLADFELGDDGIAFAAGWTN